MGINVEQDSKLFYKIYEIIIMSEINEINYEINILS